MFNHNSLTLGHMLKCQGYLDETAIVGGFGSTISVSTKVGNMID